MCCLYLVCNKMDVIPVECLKIGIRGGYSLAPHVIVRDQPACQFLVLNHHLAVTTNLTIYSILIIKHGLIQQFSQICAVYLVLHILTWGPFHQLAIVNSTNQERLFMCQYIHVYIRVSTCLCTCIFLFMFMYLPVSVQKSTCLSTGIYLFMYRYLPIYLQVSTCLCTGIHLSMYVYISIYVHVSTYLCTCVCTTADSF